MPVSVPPLTGLIPPFGGTEIEEERRERERERIDPAHDHIFIKRSL